MMSLNEAIKHAEEVAEENEKTEKEWEKALSGNHIGWSKSDIHNVENAISNCGKCAAEHRQLAAWLRELQERRKEPEIIRCAECKHRFTHNCVANVWVSVFGYTVNDDFYCGLAERRTDADD